MKECVVEKAKCASSYVKNGFEKLKKYSVSFKGNARVSVNENGKEKGALELIEDGVTVKVTDILKVAGAVVAAGVVLSVIDDLFN